MFGTERFGPAVTRGRRAPWRIVVLGGGFGGLYAAVQLADAFDLDPDDEVVLLDERNHFTFTPLLHEVAAGTLGREHLAVPFRRLAGQYGFRFRQAQVLGLDPEAARVETTAGPVDYDQCIVALGSRSRYFGNDRLEQASFPLKTLPDALRLRDRIIGLCEAAEWEGKEERRRELQTFVVAGAGPAGVETASEIHHLLTRVLPPYYPHASEGRVVLVDAGDRILGPFDEALARKGGRTLAERGLELCLETRVEDASAREICLTDGRTIPSRTLVWTAGVAPHPLAQEAGLATDRGGAEVDDALRARGHDNLFVIGDMSGAINPRTERPYPAVAPIAMSQGVRAAANVENLRAGRSLEPYHAHYAGKLVSLGAGAALVDILGLHVTGFAASVLNRAIYLGKLVGWRNKAHVAFTLGLNAVFERDLTTGWTGRPGSNA